VLPTSRYYRDVGDNIAKMGLGDIIAENSALFTSADNIALFSKMSQARGQGRK
jgi:hypothetical protein